MKYVISAIGLMVLGFLAGYSCSPVPESPQDKIIHIRISDHYGTRSFRVRNSDAKHPEDVIMIYIASEDGVRGYPCELSTD